MSKSKDKTLRPADRAALEQIQSESVIVQEFFLYMVGNGESPTMALMLATQQAPGVKGGDKGFNECARHRMESMPANQRDDIVRIAQQAGIQTAGKYYVGGLGRYGDPGAWCSTADDVMAVAKKRGLTVSGSVNYTPDDRLVDKRLEQGNPRLAPDIVDRLSAQYVASDENLQRKVLKNPAKATAEIKEMVVAKHGKKKAN